MTLRRVLVVVAALAVMVIGPASGAGAVGSGGRNGSATASSHPARTQSLTVTTFCALDAGTYRINGGVTVAPGAAFDATNCDCRRHHHRRRHRRRGRDPRARRRGGQRL